ERGLAPPARPEEGPVPAPGADRARADVDPGSRGADPHVPARSEALGGADDVPQRRSGVLGHPDDRLDGRARTRRPPLQAPPAGSRLRPLLLGTAPAHGRAAHERRVLLGREHAARLALERDDAVDRQRTAPAPLVGTRSDPGAQAGKLLQGWRALARSG